MTRPSFLALALAASTVLVAVVASDARANDAEAAQPVVTETEAPVTEPAPAPTPTVSAPDPTPPPVTASGTTGQPVVVTVPATGTQPAAGTSSSGAGASGTSSSSSGSSGTASSGTTSPGSIASSTPAGGTPATAATPEPVKPTGTQATAPAEARVITAVTSPAPATPAALAAGSPSNAAPPAAGQPALVFESLLPTVGRQLRDVQAQMDDLQRRLAGGAAPASHSLDRLRRSLDLIAPVLLALEAQVGAAQLSPHFRQLLDRVRTRLGDTHASAAALADALRRSGADGQQVRLLLRELEQFQAVAPAFALDRAPTVAAPAPGPDQGFTQNYATPTPAPPVSHTGRSQGQAAGGEATASQQPAAPAGTDTQASVSGSASAGPGGAFSVAGMGALAALLIALALPRLLSRFELPPVRRYSATFRVVLERPG
jgi:hypothetical protein